MELAQAQRNMTQASCLSRRSGILPGRRKRKLRSSRDFQAGSLNYSDSPGATQKVLKRTKKLDIIFGASHNRGAASK